MRFTVTNTKKKQSLTVTFEDPAEIVVLKEWVATDAKDAAQIGFRKRYAPDVREMILGLHSRINKSDAVQRIENASSNLTPVER